MTSSYLGGKRWSRASRSACGSFQPVTVPGLAMRDRRRSARSVPVGQPFDQAEREIDQRVVARAHDDDAVAGLRFPDQGVADLCALGDMLGLAVTLRQLS